MPLFWKQPKRDINTYKPPIYIGTSFATLHLHSTKLIVQFSTFFLIQYEILQEPLLSSEYRAMADIINTWILKKIK